MGLTAVIVASCAGLTWSRCWSWSVVRHPDKVALRPTAGARHSAPLVAAYAESIVWRCGAPPGRRGQDASGCDVNRGLEPAELRSVAGPVHVMGADDDVVTLEHAGAVPRLAWCAVGYHPSRSAAPRLSSSTSSVVQPSATASRMVVCS